MPQTRKPKKEEKMSPAAERNDPYRKNHFLVEIDGMASVETVAAALKAGAGGLGLSFDALAEIVADLRTIDAQLFSPRPKTIILRECFNSIRKVLTRANRGEHVAQIDRLLA